MQDVKLEQLSIMPYRLSIKARLDLTKIYTDGVMHFGTTRAELYFAGLEHVFGILASQPKIARLRRELIPPVRIHRHQAHIIAYLIEDGDGIMILRIRHGREDWRPRWV